MNGSLTKPVQPEKTRFVLLTSVWKRPELTRLVLSAYQRMKRSLTDRIDLCLLAVGSETASSRALCEECGFRYVEHPNSPLSDKWNAGVRAAAEYDPDALVIVGSDDLISSSMLRVYAGKLKGGFHFFGISDMYFFDAMTMRLGYWGGYERTSMTHRAGEPIGCGRCFSRSLLDRTDWRLWPDQPKMNSGLDLLCLNYLKVNGFKPVSWKLEDIGGKAVDIKNGTNINPFDAIEYQEQCEGESALDYLRPLLSKEQLTSLITLNNREVSP